jgi:hypothetical protein
MESERERHREAASPGISPVPGADPRTSRGALEDKIQELLTCFRGVLDWKWDGRFRTALAEFPVDQKDAILGGLEQSLVSAWDSARVREAPTVVQEIARSLGGLMSGQLLLLTDPAQPALLFCAWWPWGNGQRVSIRLAPFNRELAQDEAARLLADFRTRFGV